MLDAPRARLSILAGLSLLLSMACQAAPAPSTQTSTVPECDVAPGPLVISAEELAAMTLPQSELGPGYADLVFDSGFGGFVGNLDEAYRGPDYEAACADNKRFGRLAGYSGMYRRPTGGFFYIQTAVNLYRDPAGATAAYAKAIDMQRQSAGRPNGDVKVGTVKEFSVPAIGDEAHGFTTELTASDPGGQTRITFRRGPFIAWANTVRTDRNDVTAEITALAQRLDARISAVLRGDIDAYNGIRPQQRIAAEQLAQMRLPLSELGAEYAAWTGDFGAQEFTSNESFVESYRGTTIDGMIRTLTADTGRITGYSFPYTSEDNRSNQHGAGYLSTGTHLFKTPEGARRYPALFRDAEATMVARGAGGLTGSVNSVDVAGVGDSALLMVTHYSNGQARTRILFARGRLVGDLYLYRFDDKDTAAELTALAHKLDDRIQAIVH
jgi:hypothetical protein